MGIGEEEKGGEGNSSCMLHCVTEKSRHFIIRISNDTFHEMHNLGNSSLVGISILGIFCVGLW